MELEMTAQGLLTLLSTVIAIFSAWRSYRLAKQKFALERRQACDAHRGSLIDDIEQVLNSVKQENGRLAGKLEDVEASNKALAQASDYQAERIEELEAIKDRQAKRIEELEEKNACLTKRVEELEMELANLRHLKDNVR